jgi:ribosome assembly protein 4
MDGLLLIWNPETAALTSRIEAHNKHINAISWIPMHVDPDCQRIATASKDKSVKVWNVVSKICLLRMTTHTASVTKVLWGGEGYIYTAS